MRLLAETANSGVAWDLGYHFWNVTVGISADMAFGQHMDNKMTRIIAQTNLEAFRVRTLGQPVHNYVPILGLFHAIAYRFRPILRPLGLSALADSLHEVEARAEALRQVEVNYCQQLLRELHERLDAGDTTPSQIGNMLKDLPPDEELKMATTLESLQLIFELFCDS